MSWCVTFDPDSGKITSFYHRDKHKEIPKTAIDIDDQQYIQAAFEPNQYSVNPITLTLQRNS